ncbi:hypothetical protein SEA_JONJAMES_38 [Gordonia Phage JonJames]|nr:hypothetical protein SEA_JONJAMES_38 [Gordonia Phage JonJames]
MAVQRVRYEPNKPYVSNALISTQMRGMLREKTTLGKNLYARRVVIGKRPHKGPKNFQSVGARVRRLGDRLVGELYTTARHGIVREFGRQRDIQRGAYYTKFVAAKYKRSIRGRAKSRGKDAEHVLGGDNRRRQSIIATLENR